MLRVIFLAAIPMLAQLPAAEPMGTGEQYCVSGPYVLFFVPGSARYAAFDAPEIIDNAASQYRRCQENWREAGDEMEIDLLISGHIGVGEASELAFLRGRKVARAMIDSGIGRDRIYVRDVGTLRPRGGGTGASRVEIWIRWDKKKL